MDHQDRVARWDHKENEVWLVAQGHKANKASAVKPAQQAPQVLWVHQDWLDRGERLVRQVPRVREDNLVRPAYVAHVVNLGPPVLPGLEVRLDPRARWDPLVQQDRAVPPESQAREVNKV